MTDKNRTIEMYRILAEGTWDTVLVEIPADTPAEHLEETGRVHAIAQYGEYKTYMLYNSMEDDCPEVPRRSDIIVRLSFDVGQTTIGTDAQQQLAAIDQVNLILQREPHGLGARIEMDTILGLLDSFRTTYQKKSS